MACWGEVEKVEAWLVDALDCCCLFGVGAASGLPPPVFFHG